jgi:NEDD8-activating enzyme E1 regulatory subunit
LNPRTAEEKNQFKKSVLAMKKKQDEENFDEALAQAYRCWTETPIPSSIKSLFDAIPASPAPQHVPFYALLNALKEYTETVPPYTLPLSSALPDMKSSTSDYIHLQNLYRARAKEEREAFVRLLPKDRSGLSDAEIETFLKNAHALVVLNGKKWGDLDKDRDALGNYLFSSVGMMWGPGHHEHI